MSKDHNEDDSLAETLENKDSEDSHLMIQPTLAQELLSIERERIDSANRKTDTAIMMIEGQNKADERQFEFFMAQLNADCQYRDEKLKFTKNICIWGGLFILTLISILLGFVFLGNEVQASYAIEAMNIILIGGAGWGVISGIISAANKLLKNQDRE